MPTPRTGEKRNAYIGRAIKVLISEGRPQKQAVAIAESMAEEHYGKQSQKSKQRRVKRKAVV
jgi:hypothetical protein